MTKLAILSKDAQYYSAMFSQENIQDIELVWSGENKNPQLNCSDIDILLGAPNLIAPIVSQFTQLKWLQSTWAGNAPLLQHSKNDYKLTGVKEIFGPLMSEYVFTYILKFHRQLDIFERAQKEKTWTQPELKSLRHKTLGILGCGSIGLEVARTGKHFGMTIKGLTRNQRNLDLLDHCYLESQIEQMFEDMDYLINLLPDTPHTRHFINEQRLSFLPKHCVIINAGRGSTIKESALISALNHNHIKAAVLDVFEQEPLPHSHPFYSTPNLTITNHTAATSYPEDIFPIFLSNLKRYQSHQPLQYLLDFQKGY